MMMLRNAIASGFLLFAVASFPGITPAPGAPGETKQRYQVRVQAELDKLEADISSLEAQARSGGVKTRKHIGAEVAALRTKKGEADAQFAKLRGSTEEAWRDMKACVDRALAELKRRYRKAAGKSRAPRPAPPA